MVFNFVPLLEYAAVNYGIAYAAAKKASVAAPNIAENHIKLSSVSISGTRMGFQMKKWDPSRLADLDHTFRWLFPLLYLIYLISMLSLNDSYGLGTKDCDYEASIANS